MSILIVILFCDFECDFVFNVDCDFKFDCDTCDVDFDCVCHCNWVCDFVLIFDYIAHLVEIVVCCPISMLIQFSISIVDFAS